MKSRTILPGQLRLILSMAGVHAIAWFAYYAQIPTGRFPTPEESRYLDAARALAESGTAAEPTLYVLLLSLCDRFASSDSGMILLARAFNGVLMVLATGFCAAAAGRLWKKNRAVWITGVLVALNPVLVFWAGHIGPTLAATACLAFAVWRGLRLPRHPSPGDAAWTSAGLVLGVALEPGLLGLALAWPLVVPALVERQRSRFVILAAAPLVALFAISALGLLQLPFPADLHTGGLVERLYVLFNNFEFFSGKSYSLFNWLEIFLLLNPIHWGIVLILAAAGAYARFKNGHSGRSIYLLMGAFVLFAVAYLLFDLSSRERIVILPLLAIPAGGVGYLPHLWRYAGRRTRRTLVLGTLALAALTYSNLYDLRNESRLQPDYRQLAFAHLAIGSNEGATLWAKRSLEIDPNQPQLEYILARARFNDWALSAEPRSLPVEKTRALLDELLASTGSLPEMETLEAIYRWKLRQTGDALKLWQEHRETEPLALLCLYWLGKTEAPDESTLARLRGHRDYGLLADALLVDRNTLGYSELEQRVDNLLAYAY